MQVIDEVQFDHDLPDREIAARAITRIHERVQGLVFPALDIDLKDIDIRVLILIHERLESEERRRLGGLVFPTESYFGEMHACRMSRWDLRSYPLDGEIVREDLRGWDPGQHLGFECRLVVYPETVYDGGWPFRLMWVRYSHRGFALV